MTSLTLETIPPAVPLNERFSSLRRWYQRTEKTSEAAEARLLSRLAFFSLDGQKTTGSPENSKTIARVGLVDLDGDGKRKINTLSIDQMGNDFIIGRDGLQTSSLSEPMVDAQLGFTAEPQTQVPGWKIYAIDWLGMGRSSRPRFTINAKTVDEAVDEAEDFFVDSLEKWREIHKIKKMTLLGHSLGGYLAAVYALKYPERVERLILVSPIGIPENPCPPGEARSPSGHRLPNWIVRLWNANITPQLMMRLSGPFGPSLVEWYTSKRFNHLEERDQIDLYDYLFQISSASGSGEYALNRILSPGAHARKPLIRRLKHLKMPTTFIYGLHDWIDYRAGEEARKTMSVPTKLKRISNAGHHLYLDNPPEYDYAIVEEMLEQQRVDSQISL
ncbi:3128_t:CDS:2 [Paraglomus occultum]|uniref:3128_t:CDS:1 n=1 Tax=Paraglomus occultum TaxID=144539 RepID=A0A9N8W748_9GLOM|nr:3128_t:CDS:2 [Paraglomus occultum]